MAGAENLGNRVPLEWQPAADGLRLIAEGDMGLPGSMRPALISDAEGFLGMLQEIELYGAKLPDTVNRSLVNFGIQSNNPQLLDMSLRSVNAFTRFDALGDVLVAMHTPDVQFDIGEDLWGQWFEQANEAAGAEFAMGDLVGTDFQFTLIARSITEFRLHISQAVSTDEMAAVAQTAKESIVASFDAKDTEARGKIESLVGREYLVAYLTGQFDRVCGEAGLWRLMINRDKSVPYLIYKSAAGDLEAAELAALENQIGSDVQSHALSACAILAAGQLPDEDERFKLLMRQSRSPLFSRFDSNATNAFRWANPTLWAYSIGRPKLGIMDIASLENIIDIDNPDLMPAIRECYSDICRLAAEKKISAMLVLGFAMALHMTRSAHIEPGVAGNRLLGKYLEDGNRLQDALREVTPDDKSKFELVMGKLKDWMGKTWPSIDTTAELRMELDVLEAAAAIEGISADTLATLHDYLQAHWAELRARRSQNALVADMAERVGSILELSQNAIETARTQASATAVTQVPRVPSVEFAKSPHNDEPYL